MRLPRSRLAALSLLVLLLIVVCIGPVRAYFDALDSSAAQLSQRHALLLRYRTLASGASDAPAPGPLHSGSPSLLFPEGSEAAAAALLQDTVKNAAAANRIQVRSLQVLRGEASGEAAKIGVRVRAAGNASGLSQFLYSIESGRPLLYPDNLQIQASAPSGTAGDLEFQLDISGFRPKAGG